MSEIRPLSTSCGCQVQLFPTIQTPPSAVTSIHPAYAFFEAAKTIPTPTGSVLMSCFECKMAAEETIEGLIADRKNEYLNKAPPPRTIDPHTMHNSRAKGLILRIRCPIEKNIAGGIQEFACHDFLGDNFTASCDDFLSLYLPTVLYMTFEQFTPEEVCTKTKACDSVSVSRMAQLTKQQKHNLKCKACSGMQEFFKSANELPQTAGLKKFVIGELKTSACDYLGDFSTLCDQFVDAVVPKFFEKFFDIYKSEAVCSKIHPEC